MKPVRTERQHYSNEELLRVLIDEYAESVKRLAYTYVKDWSAAEDITQDVFITCFNKMDTFRGESSYKTWIMKITVNRCKDVLKSKWYKSIIPFDIKGMTLKGKSASPEEKLILKDEGWLVAETVMALPRKYREVIILFYFEEMKISEIGEMTGINSETIKSRLRRAKQLLREKLDRSVLGDE